MRLLLAVVALVLVSAVVCDNNQARYRHKHSQKWAAFKGKHLANRKSFHNDADEARAFANFEKTDELVTANNEKYANGESTYVLVHNELSHLDDEERQAYLGAIPPAEVKRAVANRGTVYVPTTLNSPARLIDWRTVWTTPPRNQGSCGSCWAHAVCGTLEAQIRSATGVDRADLSEQYLVDCDYQTSKCRGGWPETTFYFAMQNGYVYENTDVYQGVNKSCPFPPYPAQFAQVDPQVPANVRGPAIQALYKITMGPNTARDTRDALANVGPCVVCLNADAGFGQFGKGVYQWSAAAQQAQCNHAVTIVGYGNDAATKLDYFLIRNSWGTGMQDGGFIKVAANTGGDFTRYISCPYIPTAAGKTRVMPARG